MSHPFGDLIVQHLHRKHGLSQAKLAAGILQDPAVIGKMCKGQRLTGPQARERVLAIIGWLREQAVLTTVAEANALLEAAGMAGLHASEPREAALLQQFGSQPIAHHRAPTVTTGRTNLATPATASERKGQTHNGDMERLHPNVPPLARLASGYTLRARPKHNLPAQTTPLLGREPELAQLAHLLTDPTTRLVTILSAGGMGKSHLAVAAALHQVEHFADGVCWVALAPLSEAQELALAIGTTLGMHLQGGRTPEQQVADFLQTRHLLLVLDNFEHLLDGTPFIRDLLQQASQLTILVTSRQRLKLSSETVLWLDGLRFPPAVTADALTYPAVQMFVQQTRRHHAGYQPDEREIAGIVTICHLVAGMPLGILLAAAWSSVISPSEIASEIGKDPGFLQSDLHDIPARQRNLRAVFLHTWHRLSTDERMVFMRLSVFRGGATRAAIQAVTGANLAVLAALNDRALLWRLPSGRYEIHELLRQFAAEQLAQAENNQAGSQQQAARAHSGYYLRLLGEQELPIQGPEQRAAVDLLRADFENISVAWHWAVQQHEFTLLAPAVHALFLYCEVRGSYGEGAMLFTPLATELTATMVTSATNQATLSPLLGRVLAQLGACEVWMDRHERAIDYLQQSLRYEISDRERAFALTHLGRSALERGELAIGKAMLQESLAINQQCGDQGGMAENLYLQNWSFPEFIDAIHNCEESLALWRAVGRPDRIAEVVNMLAWHLCCLGDYKTAMTYWQENIERCTVLDMQHALAWMSDCMGWMAWCQGDLAAAEHYLRDATGRFHALGMPLDIAMCLSELALVRCAAGETGQAVAVARQAVEICRDSDNRMRQILPFTFLGAVLIRAGEHASARQTLLDVLPLAQSCHVGFLLIAFYYFAELLLLESQVDNLPDSLDRQAMAVTLLSCVRTQPATWQIFRDKAAQLQAEIEAGLPADLFNAAVQQGQSCTLPEMVNTLLGDEPGTLLGGAKQAL